jgi:hypothetical protein
LIKLVVERRRSSAQVEEELYLLSGENIELSNVDDEGEEGLSIGWKVNVEQGNAHDELKCIDYCPEEVH